MALRSVVVEERVASRRTDDDGAVTSGVFSQQMTDRAFDLSQTTLHVHTGSAQSRRVGDLWSPP